MKFEINIKKLKDAISVVDKIANKHLTLPVLSCILIEIKNNQAVFKSTNLDIGVEISVPVKSSGDGTLAIPGHTISSFVSQIQNENQVIKLEEISGNLKITTEKSTGIVKSQAFDDFPLIPRVTNGQEITVQSDLFLKGLKSVWYSSSISSVKPELSSVYIYEDNSDLVFVATDSFRLAEKRLKLPANIKINDILIPFKNIQDIIRILDGINGQVKVLINKNLISFESKEVYAVSRLIDGTFPDYKQIIPKAFNTEIVILKEDFMNALRISNVFSDKFNQVRFKIDPKAKFFQINTKNNDVGENSTLIDAALSGDSIEINFNYKYISDCFQSIDSDSVCLKLAGINKPMVINPVSGEKTFMYLVMPMNR